MHFFRHDRGRPPHPDVLTPAEWRVLEHIRERRTNAEIAVRLGVSVNTVRTHVSSMLAKLDAADREELARWRGEPALATRAALAGRRAPVAGPLAWLRERWASPAAKAIATVGTVVAVAVAIVGMASVAAGVDEDDEPEPTPTVAAALATPAPTEIPSPTFTPPVGMEKPSPTPKPRFEPSSGARTISGLFSDPQLTVPDEYRALDPNPRESFGPWNGEDVILYDLETMTETNLGLGTHAQFTPDGQSLYWLAGRLFEEGQELWVMDLTTGERTPLGEPPRGVYVAPGFADAGGFRIDPIAGPPQQPYPYEYTAYRLTDLSGKLAPLEFDAVSVQLTSDGTLVILAPPVDLRPQVGTFASDFFQWGMSNIFEVDPRTGMATFIATAATSIPNSPFAANERYIVWTENYCNMNAGPAYSESSSNGRTRIYDRDTGVLTELDKGLYVTTITPDNELAAGILGADALIDIESLTYTVKLPAYDQSWSPDYRYAAVSLTARHGGPCGV